MHAIRQFELMEDLEPGSAARAMLLRWNGKKYIYTSEQVEIHDFVGTHGSRGDRGYGMHSAESGKWESVGGLYQQTPGWLPT